MSPPLAEPMVVWQEPSLADLGIQLGRTLPRADPRSQAGRTPARAEPPSLMRRQGPDAASAYAPGSRTPALALPAQQASGGWRLLTYDAHLFHLACGHVSACRSAKYWDRLRTISPVRLRLCLYILGCS